VCVGTGMVQCDDKNGCTDDACDPLLGCVYQNNVSGCDDGSACTQGDVCKDGACTPGANVDCDDGSDCTTDSCDVQTGCDHVPVLNGTPCGGGKTCQAGVCVAPCAPGNKTFDYTGGPQQLIVPGGCLTVQIEAWGGKGGNRPSYSPGGNGGYTKGTLDVQPGSTVHVYVGEFPGSGTKGGWNGGGEGDYQAGNNEGGGGGGASDVRVGGTALSNRKIVAGGGGGGGGMHQSNFPGGAGGGEVGGTGTGGCPGQGGTQNAGGQKGQDQCSSQTSSDGQVGQGGTGGSGGCGLCGGGGGGGVVVVVC